MFLKIRPVYYPLLEEQGEILFFPAFIRPWSNRQWRTRREPRIKLLWAFLGTPSKQLTLAPPSLWYTLVMASKDQASAKIVNCHANKIFFHYFGSKPPKFVPLSSSPQAILAGGPTCAFPGPPPPPVARERTLRCDFYKTVADLQCLCRKEPNSPHSDQSRSKRTAPQ